ncbi:MAG: type II toxin-antitoxin system PemK/MazF family toxin [Kiritimatiellia bacterium]
MRRGEIWWAGLPDPEGSGPGYRRPVLIVQADEFTNSRINTVVVAILSSNLALAQAPGNVLVRSRYSGLAKNSVINVSQLLTIDKRLFAEKLRALDAADMAKVDDGLRLVFNIH